MSDVKPISRQLASYHRLKNTKAGIARKKRRAAANKRKYHTDASYRARKLAYLAAWRLRHGIVPRKKAE